MRDHAKSSSLDGHVSLPAEARYDFCVNASSCIDDASSNTVRDIIPFQKFETP